jgi:hypothetical protein
LKRRSQRDFHPLPLAPGVVDAIADFVAAAGKGP